MHSCTQLSINSRVTHLHNVIYYTWSHRTEGFSEGHRCLWHWRIFLSCWSCFSSYSVMTTTLGRHLSRSVRHIVPHFWSRTCCVCYEKHSAFCLSLLFFPSAALVMIMSLEMKRESLSVVLNVLLPGILLWLKSMFTMWEKINFNEVKILNSKDRVILFIAWGNQLGKTRRLGQAWPDWSEKKQVGRESVQEWISWNLWVWVAPLSNWLIKWRSQQRVSLTCCWPICVDTWHQFCVYLKDYTQVV